MEEELLERGEYCVVEENYGAGAHLEGMENYEVAQLLEGMEDYYVVVVEENTGSCSRSY